MGCRTSPNLSLVRRGTGTLSDLGPMVHQRVNQPLLRKAAAYTHLDCHLNRRIRPPLVLLILGYLLSKSRCITDSKKVSRSDRGRFTGCRTSPNLSLPRLPCTHISALTPSVPLSHQFWERGRPDKSFRPPFSRLGRRGWGMREKP